MIMMDQGHELILERKHDGVRNDGDRDLHVFVVVHSWAAEIEIFEVTSYEVGIGHGDATVKDCFDSC
jgi:hypothetical protein